MQLALGVRFKLKRLWCVCAVLHLSTKDKDETKGGQRGSVQVMPVDTDANAGPAAAPTSTADLVLTDTANEAQQTAPKKLTPPLVLPPVMPLPNSVIAEDDGDEARDAAPTPTRRPKLQTHSSRIHTFSQKSRNFDEFLDVRAFACC